MPNTFNFILPPYPYFFILHFINANLLSIAVDLIWISINLPLYYWIVAFFQIPIEIAEGAQSQPY